MKKNVAIYLVGVTSLSGGGGAERFFADFFEFYSKYNDSKYNIYFFTDQKSIYELNNVNKLLFRNCKLIKLRVFNNRFKKYLENIDIWTDIKGNIVESPNVRAAMNFVSRGELDLGIVYYSDAISENKIKIIYFLDEHYHGKIIYPLTVLNEKEETLSFYNFLIEKNSKSIMRKWGFKINR